MTESLFANYLKIALVVLSYWFISISMVFINKYLLSSDDLELDAPLFVTWFQCVVTVVLCLLLRGVRERMPAVLAFPDVTLHWRHCKGALPLSIVFVCMTSFNNLCLKYVGVAFYYVGRSLTTVFNMTFSYLLLGQKTSLPAIGCCMVSLGGFILGIDQEALTGSLSAMGVAFGLASSVCVALNAVMTKRVLPLVNDNLQLLALYNNINACVIFLPLLLLSGDVTEVLTFPKLSSTHFWTWMVVSGVFGFAIGYAISLQIKVTSPLTHDISGSTKTCLQTVGACIYFKEVKSGLWWLSNVLVLLASASYTEVKRRQLKQQHQRTVRVDTVQKALPLTGSEDSSDVRIEMPLK